MINDDLWSYVFNIDILYCTPKTFTKLYRRKL